MPFFSVVVPVYNVRQWVGRAIESILAQTFEDFELILIDD
ncbi:MAG: glycosyltransferase, partial [Thermoguttaceae bacterium]|nr:glycosyltransferase [Thermoguttaceae bacterium]